MTSIKCGKGATEFKVAFASRKSRIRPIIQMKEFNAGKVEPRAVAGILGAVATTAFPACAQTGAGFLQRQDRDLQLNQCQQGPRQEPMRSHGRI
jgi:hypothetical protein